MKFLKAILLVAAVSFQLSAQAQVDGRIDRDRGGGNHGGGWQQDSLREGEFNYRRNTYYSNGQGAYCRQPAYKYNLRELNQYEERIMSRMRNDGFCGGFDSIEGTFNHRGNSYYANGQGAYCQFTRYNSRYRELSRNEQHELSRMRFDGYCR